MKTIKLIRNSAFIAATLLLSASLTAQDSVSHDLNITLRYFMYNNSIPYLTATTRTKVDGKFQPVKNIGLSIYLDSVAPSNLAGKINTNDKGESNVVIPGSLKSLWDASPTHKFLAVSEENKEFPETKSDLEITKAKLEVDTTNQEGAKNITAKIFEQKDGQWVPVKDVEMKIGIRRLGGMLLVGKETTYTTDSTGEVTAEFKRDSLPGDKGILTLVVNVEDNDKYGNLVLEQKLPWGVNISQIDDWNKRTLFAARFRAPIWLLIMAYSIISTVWGVLIYLLIQIVKIRKIGRNIAIDI